MSCAMFVDPSGECRPDLRLKGHQKEGYQHAHYCCRCVVSVVVTLVSVNFVPICDATKVFSPATDCVLGKLFM